ncbi:hypothetical protein Sste5346_008077 [Sporothrix stenoceras]|uniref:C6 zinc finger domain containing protein n=1 Tax=Sporothrix stenoceras TaxID=5173 RepID=A0ABR3YS79_9PEZI
MLVGLPSLPLKRRGPKPSPSTTTTDEASPADSHYAPSENITLPTNSSLPGDAAYSSSQDAAGTGMTAGSAQWLLSTDRICSRRVFDAMIQDYLDLQYPLMPLFHRPSFRRDLDAGRETTDAIFFSLLVTMCAALVANVPSTFYKYKSLDDGSRFCLPYATRSDMVNDCHDIVMQLRRFNYADTTTHEKWSIAYLLGVAHGNMQHQTRSMMLSAEADHHLRQMHSYHTVTASRHRRSNIELQLHHKAVCLSAIGYLVELDPFEPPFVNELQMHKLTYWKETLLEVDDDRRLEVFDSPTPASPAAKQQHLELLKAGFEKQKHALDDVPKEFDEWTIGGGTQGQRDTDPVVARQFEIMRANIRVTHLWLQSLIFEDIVSLSTEGEQEPSSNLRNLWDDRENICRQLLHVLYNISHDNLAPNGSSLVHKIRVVAATLVDCPFEFQGSIGRQAYSYIQAFASLLSTLDGANDTAHSLNVWTNLDQYKRCAVPDFS